MGNCYGKQRSAVQVNNREIRHEEDDVPYMLVLSNSNQPNTSNNARFQSRRWWHTRNRNELNLENTQPTWAICRLTEEELDKHVLETLNILRNSAENDSTLIIRMRMFKFWANGDIGWNMVLSSLVRSIPLDDALGSSAITLFIDHCPLPTKQAVLTFISSLALSKGKAEDEFTDRGNKSVRRRNICAVLGHLVETLAGPLSSSMMTDDVLQYLLTGLNTTVGSTIVDANSILYSLIALEKFALTGVNKERILKGNIVAKLLRLENWAESKNYKKRQVGFCSKWLLDNVFVAEGRTLTYETISLKHINSMLNVNDVSEYLKISCDGLEARSDASSFESVRCTFSVDSGVWYYEVTMVTSGVMQIGWATKNSKFFNHDGYGIGDDEYSYAYDGCRQLLWHQAHSRRHSHPAWQEGDTLGLLLDLDKYEVVFSLNGVSLPPETAIFCNARNGFFAAASFMSHQQCSFNFGATPFKHPPTDREFSSFNQHAYLSDEDKIILPKHKKLELLKSSPPQEDACTLCCDLRADTQLHPCGHDGLCHRCASIIEFCPLCRSEIVSKTTQTGDELEDESVVVSLPNDR